MGPNEFREILAAEPFEPFRIHLSSGDTYRVTDPQSVAVMKSRIFLALPGDEWVFIPYLHIAAVKNGRNGHSPKSRRGRGRG